MPLTLSFQNAFENVSLGLWDGGQGKSFFAGIIHLKHLWNYNPGYGEKMIFIFSDLDMDMCIR